MTQTIRSPAVAQTKPIINESQTPSGIKVDLRKVTSCK